MAQKQKKRKGKKFANDDNGGHVDIKPRSKSMKKVKKTINGKVETLDSEEPKPIEIQPEENGPLRGMKKWLSEYRNKRPGFKIVQQRIDEFIEDLEDREEKARKEREAALAEEGWTVVEHHKGRKKTTDSESGVAVGAVAASAAAALQKKKKKEEKDAAVNFYRFQRREARRNEILELQQRFEEDKKKVAALRAARKFRPY